MFSANENLLLRKHKRRIVNEVESCIPEETLDLGTSVMVMQVSCKAPGCVPLETAIIIVFPASKIELMEGLPESKGGSYKTKVLKPMSEVQRQDVLEALPPAFVGGLRSMETLCITARDVAIAQITQLFGDDDMPGRKLMAEYLQQSLQEYIDRDCVPPPLCEPFVELAVSESKSAAGENNDRLEPSPSTVIPKGTGNVVIRRAVDDVDEVRTAVPTKVQPAAMTTQPSRVVAPTPATSTTKTTVAATTNSGSMMFSSIASQRQQQAADRALSQSTNSSLLSRLNEREHAPGIRRPGCPCCDPDNPANVVDQMMQLYIPDTDNRTLLLLLHS